MSTKTPPRQTEPAGRAKNCAADKFQVLLVDDHPIILEGLTRVINREPDLMVCGCARNHHEALQRIETLQPELCVVDVTLANSHGIDLVKEILALNPQLPAIMLSMHDEKLYGEQALRAGARGYVMKRDPPKKLLEAIRKVMQGELYFSDSIMAKLSR